jgi:hypothetical protein
LYFPKWFSLGNNIFIEYYKDYLTVKADLIIQPENKEALTRMKEICEYFIEEGKPKLFDPRSSQNIVIQHEKSFEHIIASIQELGISTEKITIFEFYTKIEYFENKYSKLKPNGSRIK